MPNKRVFPKSLQQEIRYQNKLREQKQRLKIKPLSQGIKEKAWFLVWAMGFAGRKTYKDFTVIISFEDGKTKKEFMDLLVNGFRGFDFVRKT